MIKFEIIRVQVSKLKDFKEWEKRLFKELNKHGKKGRSTVVGPDNSPIFIAWTKEVGPIYITHPVPSKFLEMKGALRKGTRLLENAYYIGFFRKIFEKKGKIKLSIGNGHLMVENPENIQISNGSKCFAIIEKISNRLILEFSGRLDVLCSPAMEDYNISDLIGYIGKMNKGNSVDL